MTNGTCTGTQAAANHGFPTPAPPRRSLTQAAAEDHHVAIMAAFAQHRATYDRRTVACAVQNPGHHAEKPSRPRRNRMRTMADREEARFAFEPRAMMHHNHGVNRRRGARGPTEERTSWRSLRPRVPASRSSPRPVSCVDRDEASGQHSLPSRFCRNFGTLSAAVNASLIECPQVMPHHPRANESGDATEQDARGHRAAYSAEAAAARVRQQALGIRLRHGAIRYLAFDVRHHPVRIAGGGTIRLAAAISLALAAATSRCTSQVGRRLAFIAICRSREAASEREPVPDFLRASLGDELLLPPVLQATSTTPRVGPHDPQQQTVRVLHPPWTEEGRSTAVCWPRRRPPACAFSSHSRLQPECADIVATGPSSPERLAREMTWHTNARARGGLLNLSLSPAVTPFLHLDAWLLSAAPIVADFRRSTTTSIIRLRRATREPVRDRRSQTRTATRT